MTTTALLKLVQHPDWQTALGIRPSVAGPFLERLRTEVPEHARQYDATERAWLIHPEHVATVSKLLPLCFDEVFWDRMILRDMEDVPIPPDSAFVERTVERTHYQTLGVSSWAPLIECREQFHDVRETYYEGKIGREAYEAAAEAFERICFFASEEDAHEAEGTATTLTAPSAPGGSSAPAPVPSYEPDGGIGRARRALQELERRLHRDGSPPGDG